MPEQIRDGSGKGFLAAVNSDNQLQTRAVAVAQRLESALDGNYYEVTTGKIELTTANETSLFYIKNSENKVIVIDRVFYDVWESTGGSVGGTIEYYRNPTYTGGVAATQYNTEFSSDDQLDATVLTWSVGSPLVLSGNEWWRGYVPVPSSNVVEEGRFVLNTNNTFGISIVPPASNTSMYVAINVALFVFDVDLT